MQNARFTYLFDRYMSKSCTPDEKQEFMQAIYDEVNGDDLEMLTEKALQHFVADNYLSSREADALFEKIIYEQPVPSVDIKRTIHRVHFLKTTWFRYAAALIAILGISSYLWLSTRHQPASTTANNTQHKNSNADILPGGNKATLTLADGSKIMLDNTASKNIADKGTTNILTIDANQLTYKTPLLEKEGAVFDPREAGQKPGVAGHNTITTPKGGQYQIILPDGSKIWLNALSSIKFPTSFTGSTRTVEIAGEAYLEVAKNSKQPFLVNTNGAKIQVLGTSFNVKSYETETFKTSLVEGSIKVAGQLLTPGQAYSNGKITTTNLEQDIAWKNGVFNFEGLTVKEVMNQLQRWYDIEVVYENGIPTTTFFGEIGKDVGFSGILAALENIGIHFRMEGKKLIVTP